MLNRRWFIAILIILVVGAAAAACQPIMQNTPAIMPVVVIPTATGAVEPTALLTETLKTTPTTSITEASAEALAALKAFTLPDPTSFPTTAIAKAFANGDYQQDFDRLKKFFRVWVSARKFWDQPLTEVMRDPDRFNSIKADFGFIFSITNFQHSAVQTHL